MNITEFFKEFGLELLATLSVAALGFIFFSFRKQVIITIARLILPEVKSSGLVMTHNSMNDALKNITESVKRTTDLKVLSNKGTDWLGDDNVSLSQLVSQKSLSNFKVRVLLLSKIAPWLSVGWAEERSKPSLPFVQEEFDMSHRLVESFLKKNTNLSHKSGIRYHRDDPIWRMLMTDDRVFFSSYANVDQARDAIVYEFEGPNNEIYQAFKRYFNFLWHRRGIQSDTVEESFANDAKYDNYEISAGAVVYGKVEGVTKILLVERNDYLFTLPKGHINNSERLSHAAIREINEETGLPTNSLKIIKSIGWYPNPILVGDTTRVFKLVNYFLVYCDDTSSKLKVDTDHKSVGWYSFDEIENMKFAYSHVERTIYEASVHLK